MRGWVTNAELMIQDRMIHVSVVVKFCPHCLNMRAEIITPGSRPFSCCPNSTEPVWTVVYLFYTDRSNTWAIFPCCGPSARPGCKQQDISLTGAVLYLLEPVRPLTSDLRHQQIIFVQTCPSAAHCSIEATWQTRFKGIRSTWSK